MVVATRERTKEELRRRGFEVLDSSANFLLAKPNSVDAGWLFEELKKEKIFVRHFNGERIKDYLRISIGTDQQMDCLLQAIDRIMALKERKIGTTERPRKIVLKFLRN